MIKLIKSTFYNEEKTKKEICDFIMSSEQLSFSKYCKQFEKQYAAWQWSKYCIFFNSWSSANLAIIQTLINMWKLKVWDNVWFSSLTWSTNVMPIIQLWLKPFPIDIEINTLNVSLEMLKKSHQEKKLKVFFITNLLWFCDNIDEIKKYCDENNILLIEDNCESMGTVFKWKKLGNYWEMWSFSTYVWHHMSTVEWWMVCTDDYEYYKMLVIVRAHWWDRNLEKEEQIKIRKENNIENSIHSSYTFYNLWYNLRPSELNWFIWCTQMKYLDEIVEKREQHFKRFVEVINKNNEIESVKYDHIDLVSSFSIPIICKDKDLLDKYTKIFNDGWVEIRPIVWWDMTKQIFWKKLYWENNNKTNSRYIHENWFYFWNSPEYTEEEIELICSLLK